MTMQNAGSIAGRRFALDDTGGLVCLDCLESFRNVERFARHSVRCPGTSGGGKVPPELATTAVGPMAGPVARPDDDPIALPPGYAYAGRWSRGGYGTVKAPDGRELEGPDKGKFHGRSDAADAAWADHESAAR
jgi:hypothetical protein